MGWQQPTISNIQLVISECSKESRGMTYFVSSKELELVGEYPTMTNSAVVLQTVIETHLPLEVIGYVLQKAGFFVSIN